MMPEDEFTIPVKVAGKINEAFKLMYNDLINKSEDKELIRSLLKQNAELKTELIRVKKSNTELFYKFKDSIFHKIMNLILKKIDKDSLDIFKDALKKSISISINSYARKYYNESEFDICVKEQIKREEIAENIESKVDFYLIDTQYKNMFKEIIDKLRGKENVRKK